MNAKMKRRLVAVAGVIVIVVVIAFALIGGSTSAKAVSVADCADGSLTGQKVEVSGTVVDNSYDIDEQGVLTFSLCDEGASSSDAVSGNLPTVRVSYDKGVSATFGNGISAICTGRINEDGTLVATELVTKCPSKYENASEALSVSSLLGYGQSMIGKTVKLEGVLADPGMGTVDQPIRFTLEDASAAGAQVAVHYEGAISQEQSLPGSKLVIQGALGDDGVFNATSVAMGE